MESVPRPCGDYRERDRTDRVELYQSSLYSVAYGNNAEVSRVSPIGSEDPRLPPLRVKRDSHVRDAFVYVGHVLYVPTRYDVMLLTLTHIDYARQHRGPDFWTKGNRRGGDSTFQSLF